MVHEEVQQRLHAEIDHGGAEEHRGLPAGEIRFQVKGMRRPLHQLQLGAQFVQRVRADAGLQGRVVQTFVYGGVLAGEIAPGLVQVHFVVMRSYTP